jgi:hypothetical protein
VTQARSRRSGHPIVAEAIAGFAGSQLPEATASTERGAAGLSRVQQMV